MVAAGWILVLLVLILCVLTSMEDLREGLSRNRTLKPFLVGFLGLDMIYYGFFFCVCVIIIYRRGEKL